jgi:hypothetical protein
MAKHDFTGNVTLMRQSFYAYNFKAIYSLREGRKKGI